MARKPGTYATFKTSEGTIVTELFEKDAPETVAKINLPASATTSGDASPPSPNQPEGDL